MRQPNQSQNWHCATCGEETVLKIGKTPSAWKVHQLGMQGYERWHECKCGNYVTTLEIDTDELFKLEMELKQLRKVKSEHDQLLAALRDRSAAEQRINAIVHPTTEISSNQTINMTPVTLENSRGS